MNSDDVHRILFSLMLVAPFLELWRLGATALMLYLAAMVQFIAILLIWDNRKLRRRLDGET
jgi:hypothetical protein